MMNVSIMPQQKHREEAGGCQPSLGGCEGDSPVIEKSCQGLMFPREIESWYNYNTLEKLLLVKCRALKCYSDSVFFLLTKIKFWQFKNATASHSLVLKTEGENNKFLWFQKCGSAFV